jgi:rhamnose utilization protein RhaD (predicted bifunctional aldolase and dehydrogenase)/NAD(P)-dependent dehydrogenase (short-subunit alcohol dehydrogenase family)
MPQDWPQFGSDATLMDKLVGVSRYYGSDPSFVLGGGGNTSAKTEDVLYVKASGYELGTIGPEGFVALDRRKLAAMLESPLPDDAAQRERQFVAGVQAACLQSGAKRPSVESLLHNLMPQRLVVHTHCALINALACCTRGRELVRELLGDDVLWVDFVEPGYRLAKTISAELAAYAKRTGSAQPRAIVLQNHGLLVGGQEPDEVREVTARVLDAVRDRVGACGPREGELGPVSRRSSAEALRLMRIVAPALRGLLASDEQVAAGRLEIVCFDDSPAAMTLAGSADGPAITDSGALMPDQIAYCGPYPMWFAPPDGLSEAQVVESLRSAVSAYRSARKVAPQIVMVAGVGLFAAGSDYASASLAKDVYLNAVCVMAAARRLGGIHVLEAKHREFIEGWEIEAYRKRVLKSACPGRAAGKVALVTGAAQGFGLEIAQDLAAQGAYVILGDVNAAGAAAAAGEIARREGLGRALGLAMNVTDPASVGVAVDAAVRQYGGLDLLVSNAGVLRAAGVRSQTLADFDFVTSVNYRGYFLCVQAAAGVMSVQHRAQPAVWADIIQINSKSGLQGSKANFAYAGGKFGGVGLTQSFAMELVDEGIKVNAVCPGNFFEGPLWSDPKTGLFVQYLRAGKVSGAKTVDDVRKAYESKVPMGRGCRTADVMKAIYYIMEQQYETGQAVPVTGGQVMLK